MANTRTKGELLTAGKTKAVHATKEDDKLVIIESKDAITAGDGAKRDEFEGKAAAATWTNCNVMRFLNECGVPTAFVEQVDDTHFIAKKCGMIPLEVVARRVAKGSYCRRNRHVPDGTVFPRLKTEFFLKTTNLKLGEREFPWDDPYLTEMERPGHYEVHDPKAPLGTSPPEHVTGDEIGPGANKLREIEAITRQVFWLLEKAWQIQGGQLVDFKLEFGLTTDGQLVLSDVVDNDSWRVLFEGRHIDKQYYRDGGELSEVAQRYNRVADLTGRFSVPKQRLVLWVGSTRDNKVPFEDAHEPYHGVVPLRFIQCSMHKEPQHGLAQLHQLLQEAPNSVLLVHVGLSNGAGPTLSAACSVPVINVPAGVDKRPHDLWSNVQMPSLVPCSTVLRPSNAVNHAMHILAASNPRVYAKLREQLEPRLQNTVSI